MKKLKSFFSGMYLTLIFIFLYAPIVTLIIFSFNEGKGSRWKGFSLKWYEDLFESRMIMEALSNTLIIAFVSALVATLVGTITCIGINALKGKFKTTYMAINNIPLMNSDLVTGLSLMLVFISVGWKFGFSTILVAHITLMLWFSRFTNLGYVSILLAHITFNIPYVILSVMPRLRQTNVSTYEAAMDLGATPLSAFFKVVLPDLAPGITSGFLLAFTMSLDDFIITYFTRGAGINTLSTLIYSEVRKGIKPTMNALSTVMFVSVLLLLVLMNTLPDMRDKRKRKQEEKS